MNETTLWGLFIAVGIATLALRVAFIEGHGRWHVPPLLQRALKYVPASVLAALVAPAVVLPPAGSDVLIDWPRLIAATLAAAMAWRFRNTLYSLFVGMGTLLAIQNLPALLAW